MTIVADLLSLESKVAIVTGAATGIGREVAELFSAAGAKVAAGDVNTDALASLDTAAHKGRLDVSDQASVRAFFTEAERKLGGVDILVNVAGIYPFAKFETMDVESWDRVQAVNTRGVFLTCQAALPLMQKRGGGSIVNVSSVNSVRALIRNNVHYAASKAAVNGMTLSMALEFAEAGIRVNAILPGGVATNQAGKAMEGWEMSGPITQPGRIPLTGTSGLPADIANAALFLSSGASSYITGQLIAIDGGFLVS